MAFLRKLLKSRQARQTDELSAPPAAPPVIRPLHKVMRVGWASDVGRQRSTNEDSVLVVEAFQEGHDALEPFGLFIVADGMGGHKEGEVVSALAVRTAAYHILQQFYLASLGRHEHGADQASIVEILEQAAKLANSAVAAAVPGGGTTLICALVMGRRVYLANVGDSRAYIVAPQGMEQVTRDHSLVDRLVEMGQLTAEEAATHPQKNVLYRAVGQGGTLEVDTFVRSLPAGSHLLLCTDGLWSMVAEAEIASIIARASSPQEAGEALVAAANRAGGKDNISVIVVEFPLTDGD